MHEAADLAQDTFVRVLGHPARKLQEPRAFLATVARSVLIDHTRRLSLERAYLQTLAQLPEPVSPSPEERLAALQALEEVDRMLDGLPDKEIAARLGVSISSVEKYVANGLRQCYRLLYPDAS